MQQTKQSKTKNKTETKQNKTEQNKTKQNKKKQNKTKQNVQTVFFFCFFLLIFVCLLVSLCFVCVLFFCLFACFRNCFETKFRKTNYKKYNFWNCAKFFYDQTKFIPNKTNIFIKQTFLGVLFCFCFVSNYFSWKKFAIF